MRGTASMGSLQLIATIFMLAGALAMAQEGKASGETTAAACSPCTSTSTNPAVARAEAEMLQADREFNQDVQQSGLEGWVRWFSDRGVMFQGDSAPPALGAEPIRKAMAEEFALPGHTLTWQPDGARALDSGKNGLTWGRWQRQFQGKDGKIMQLTGQYITVWRKQKDGSWRVVWDGGEAKPVATKPATPGP